MPGSELPSEDAEPVKSGAPPRSEIPQHSPLGEKLSVLAQAFEDAPDGIQVTDMTGHIVYANKAIEKTYGFTPEEQRGKHVSEMNAEPGFADKHILPSIRNTGHWEGEVLAKHKDGRIFSVSLTASVVKDDQGKPIALTGISRDLTERKKAEEEKEKLLHDVEERVKELNCLYSIAKIVAIPDISLGELCQETAEIIPPSWQYPEITCARILIHDQVYKTANFRKTKWLQAADITEYGSKAGTVEVYYLEESPVLYEGPFLKEERYLIEGIAERLGSVAERKRAAEALEDQVARQTALLSATQAYVYLKDRDLKYIAMNNTMADMLGIDLDSVPGKTDFDFFPKQDANSFRAFDRQVMESGVPVIDLEETYDTPDGDTRWALTSKVPYHGPDGDVIGIVGTSMDITALKRTEIALASSEKKYRKLLELANDAIFVAEVETGIIVEANQKASELLGRPVEEIIGLHHTEVHPPENADHHREKFKQHVDEVRGNTAELLVRHASGHDIAVEVSSSVVELDGKKFMKGIFRDLTTRNRAKELGDSLNKVNSIINSTLKISEVTEKVVATSAVAVGADSAAFFLAEGDHWVLEQVHGPSPHEPGTKIPYDMLNPPPRMAENPAPVAISDACNDDRANKEMARKIGLRSLMLIPLVSDEQVLGMLIFRYFTKKVEFTSEELDFSTKLGASISLALENARLFSEQQRIASTLQKALLVVPEKLPHIEFGHLYRSASEAAMVGGDFYDLFALQGDRVGIVVGDVSGKGLEAAALTSTLKHLIKGYAYEGHSPAAVMSKTNIVIMKETDSATFVTTFVGILDTDSGVLTYCCAGHPPPIIKRQNGDIDLLEPCCLPIGVLDFLDARDKQQRIKEGDLITLYTDGVIEARCASDMFGESRLIDFLRNTTKLSAAEAPGRIVDELTRCGCTLSDDLAIVSLSLPND